MKNVDELYEKTYYNAYKNGCENDELSKAKKKKNGYKQFELFDKTDKKLTLDEETKISFKEIENQEKIVAKKKFKEYFSYETTALVNNLLSQNTQDLGKCLNQIKQQKMKEDERNSTNKKNINDELNNILSVINRIYQFFEYKFLPGEQPDESNLPKWIKVDKSKQRFNEIKKKVQDAKINNLQARSKVSKVINTNESNKLIHEIENGQITYEEALKRTVSTCSDINKIISMQSLNLNQVNVLNNLFMINEIFTGDCESVEVNKEDNFDGFKEKLDKEKQESDEQLDTRDIPKLESDESAVERRN